MPRSQSPVHHRSPSYMPPPKQRLSPSNSGTPSANSEGRKPRSRSVSTHSRNVRRDFSYSHSSPSRDRDKSVSLLRNQSPHRRSVSRDRRQIRDRYRSRSTDRGRRPRHSASRTPSIERRSFSRD